MLLNYLTLLREIRWYDFLDIGLAALLILLAIHPLRTSRTRRAGFGLLLFGGIFLIADQMDLKLTVWFMKGIAAVVVLIVVVAYHSELRRILDRFPTSLFGHPPSKGIGSADMAGVLVDVLETLSLERKGALIVLPGKEPLEGLVTPGTPLRGNFSKALLLSLFDPHSPGHDGALVILEGQVERFGSRLPLSEQEEQLQERGTRHAAALGRSEKSDASVLVVSEETGRISLARRGRLQVLADPDRLRTSIGELVREPEDPGALKGSFRRHPFLTGFEGLVSLIVAALFWLVLVPGSVVETATYEVPVEVQNIPENYSLESVTPPKVAVTLSGEKRNLFHVKPEELVIRLDGTLTRFGRQTFPISSTHLLLPPKVEIAGLVPEQVRVRIREE